MDLYHLYQVQNRLMIDKQVLPYPKLHSVLAPSWLSAKFQLGFKLTKLQQGLLTLQENKHDHVTLIQTL